MARLVLLSAALQVLLQSWQASGAAVQMNAETLLQYRADKKVVFLNFYADWCRYSQQLKPIFDKAADQIHEELEGVTLGRVDCDANKALCQNEYHITKYPTLKLIRQGEIARREYRGKRSVEALVEFVKGQVKDPVTEISNYQAIDAQLKEGGKAVVGFFQSKSSNDYHNYNQIALSLRDDCKFFVIFKESNPDTKYGFHEQGGTGADQQYSGDVHSYQDVRNWIHELCLPLVREITFENGEELTEQGLPFLILFYDPDQPDTKQVFRRVVEEQLMSERGSVAFVTADGIKFAHPLHHLGKSKKDLPLLAIDSFRHMYIFPKYEDIHVPGKLLQFVSDLKSGKLHREFHHGPDPTQGHHHGDHQARSAPSSDPPESSFKKLKPAESRYSLLHHDEL